MDFSKVIFALEDIIDDRVKLNTSPLIVKEKNNQNRVGNLCRDVEISGFDLAFAFKLDTFGIFSPYFSKRNIHINKGCDLSIFALIDGLVYIFLCELKSTKSSGFKYQIRNSELFINYLKSLMSEYYGVEIEKFKTRYILISTKHTNKNLTKKVHKINPINEAGFIYYHLNCKEIVHLKKLNLL